MISVFTRIGNLQKTLKSKGGANDIAPPFVLRVLHNKGHSALLVGKKFHFDSGAVT